MPGSQHSLTYGFPLSDAELNKVMGNGVLRRFLEQLASRDRVTFFDDFLDDTLATDKWAVATGASATAFVSTLAEDGTVLGTAGTTAATSGLQLFTPAQWYGDRNMGCEVRFKVGAVITGERLEIGFANAVPAVNTPLVNSLATPTFNTVTDAVLFVYDHDGTSTTVTGLYGIGQTGITANKAVFTSPVVVAAQYHTVRICVVGDAAFLWFDGALVASGPLVTQGGTAQLFVISSKTQNTTTKTITIDYVRVWKDRSV